MKKTWHPLAIAIGASVTACFVKPDAPQGTPIDDAQVDSQVDGQVDSPSPPPCLRDDFEMGSACGSWGSASISGTGAIGRTSGQLTMFASSTAGAASCTTLAEMAWGGPRAFTIKVADFMNVNGAFTGIRAIASTTEEFGVDIRGGGGTQGMLYVEGPTGLQPTSVAVTAPLYIKLFQPEPNMFAIGVGASPTAVQEIGKYSLAGIPTAMVRVRMRTTAPTSGTTPTAHFDDLDTCVDD